MASWPLPRFDVAPRCRSYLENPSLYQDNTVLRRKMRGGGQRKEGGVAWPRAGQASRRLCGRGAGADGRQIPALVVPLRSVARQTGFFSHQHQQERRGTPTNERGAQNPLKIVLVYTAVWCTIAPRGSETPHWRPTFSLPQRVFW